jgi:type II secretory pathway pseudopilin PulG
MKLIPIKKNTEAFSVIELIVVMSIFTIISSVSMFNYTAYQSRITRVNTAQDIALSIRQSQVYGLSASGQDLGAAEFDTDADAADIFFGDTVVDIISDRSIRGINIDPGSKTLILFEDLNRNNVFNNASDRVIDKRTVISEQIFFQACLFSMGVSIDDLGACPIEADGDINITFQRPYPDSTIEYSSTQYGSLLLNIKKLESDEPDIAVQIDPAGQIFVHNT